MCSRETRLEDKQEQCQVPLQLPLFHGKLSSNKRSEFWDILELSLLLAKEGRTWR